LFNLLDWGEQSSGHFSSPTTPPSFISNNQPLFNKNNATTTTTTPISHSPSRSPPSPSPNSTNTNINTNTAFASDDFFTSQSTFVTPTPQNQFADFFVDFQVNSFMNIPFSHFNQKLNIEKEKRE
jgi:hypothetical protein